VNRGGEDGGGCDGRIQTAPPEVAGDGRGTTGGSVGQLVVGSLLTSLFLPFFLSSLPY